jgi:hypothetical protein
MSRLANPPPETSLVYAQLEAEKLGVKMNSVLGRFVLETAERPAVQEMFAALPVPEPVEPPPIIREVYDLLATDMKLGDIARQRYGISIRTLGRHTGPAYQAMGGYIDAGDTARRIAEYDIAHAPPGSYANLLPVPLTPGQHLQAILLSRGWSLRQLEASLGSLPHPGTRTGLSNAVGYTGMAAITFSLFRSGQLLPDAVLHADWQKRQTIPTRPPGTLHKIL